MALDGDDAESVRTIAQIWHDNEVLDSLLGMSGEPRAEIERYIGGLSDDQMRDAARNLAAEWRVDEGRMLATLRTIRSQMPCPIGDGHTTLSAALDCEQCRDADVPRMIGDPNGLRAGIDGPVEVDDWRQCVALLGGWPKRSESKVYIGDVPSLPGRLLGEFTSLSALLRHVDSLASVTVRAAVERDPSLMPLVAYQSLADPDLVDALADVTSAPEPFVSGDEVAWPESRLPRIASHPSLSMGTAERLVSKVRMKYEERGNQEDPRLSPDSPHQQTLAALAARRDLSEEVAHHVMTAACIEVLDVLAANDSIGRPAGFSVSERSRDVAEFVRETGVDLLTAWRKSRRWY